MGTIISYPEIPVRTPVPDGKQRICIVGLVNIIYNFLLLLII